MHLFVRAPPVASHQSSTELWHTRLIKTVYIYYSTLLSDFYSLCDLNQSELVVGGKKNVPLHTMNPRPCRLALTSLSQPRTNSIGAQVGTSRYNMNIVGTYVRFSLVIHQ
jgi:hypothetical protein